MNNNIKKASVKFWERTVVFSAFYADFCLCPKSVIITSSTTSSPRPVIRFQKCSLGDPLPKVLKSFTPLDKMATRVVE